MVAAAGAATQTEIQNALAVDPNVFGTAGAITSAMGGIVDNALGALGFEAGDPMDSGIGDGTQLSEDRSELGQAVNEIFDTIVGASFDASQQAAQDNVFALVDDGLLSPLVAEGLASAFDSLNSQAFVGEFSGGFGDGFDPFSSGFGGADAQLQQALFEQQFIEGFQEGLEQFTETFEESLDDIIQDLESTAATSVTITLNTGSDSYDFINNQNDILISTDNDNSFSLTVGNQAETGDFLEGGDANDFVTFASSSNNLSHVFAMKDVEHITLPNVGSGNQFALNIQSAGTTTIDLSDTGTNSIAGTPESGSSADLNQQFIFADSADGSTNTLELTGSTGNDVATFGSSNDVVTGMTGVEFVVDTGGNLTFQSAISGVTIATSGTTGSLILDDGGNTVTIGQISSGIGVSGFTGFSGGITWSSVTGGSGVDSVTVNASSSTVTVSNFNGGSGSDSLTVQASSSNNATVNNISNVTSLTGTKNSSGNVIVSLADSGVTISSVSGTFDTFTGGTSTDQITLANSGVTLSNISDVETINGGSSGDTITVTGSTATTVNAGAGNDSITGGQGSDHLTGGTGADRFIFAGAAAGSFGTDTLVDFNGATNFFGGSGESDVMMFDNVNLGLNTKTYEEVSWDGSTTAINLTNANATVILLHTTAGSTTDAITALAAGNAAGDGTSGDAIILVHDSSNSDRLTVLHSSDIDNGTGVNAIGVLTNATDPSTSNNLAAGDFALF